MCEALFTPNTLIQIGIRINVDTCKWVKWINLVYAHNPIQSGSIRFNPVQPTSRGGLLNPDWDPD